MMDWQIPWLLKLQPGDFEVLTWSSLQVCDQHQRDLQAKEKPVDLAGFSGR